MSDKPTIHTYTGRDRYSREVMVHDSHALDLTGRIALRLVEHFGVIVGDDDGEDSAGRAKIKAMDPEKIVVRACDIATHFVQQAQARGWLHALPVPPAEVED